MKWEPWKVLRRGEKCLDTSIHRRLLAAVEATDLGERRGGGCSWSTTVEGQYWFKWDIMAVSGWGNEERSEK